MDITLPLPFDTAEATTRDALKTEGFGILTTIDMQAAFREKLGREFRRYTILGACNPPLAHAALSHDPTVGLLLPCNVIIEEQDASHTIVRLTDPLAMLATAVERSPAVTEVAEDAHARMTRVHQALHVIANARGA
jgi:uncharacterized protein (DUF302 family)